MSTDFKVKLTSNKMLELFDSELLNIRFYERYKPETDYYKIRIRHPENKKPETLLLNALKTIGVHQAEIKNLDISEYYGIERCW